MLAEFTAWLLNLVKEWWSTFWTFVTDAAISLLGLLGSAVISLLGAIPVPFSGSSLATLWGALDPGVMWVLVAIGVPQALGIFGAAHAFRLVRKVVTLFQW